MQLSLATNFDPLLIPQLRPYPVEEIYGKLPRDFAGGGRPSYMGTAVSERELGEYAALLSENGIAFNYLLNSSCLGNREWSRAWQKELMRFLDRLQGMGIGRLTVSTPFLLELVKARFPEFFVKVGIYAQVDTPRRAKFWEELGADAITLESFSINRNFHRLSAIRRAVKCELQLIVNHPCLPNCPMQPYHQNGFAHSSDGSGRVFIDYCFLRCTRKRLEDPSLFIKAAWIRPEDLQTYEAIGYTRFKLLERGIPSVELLKRVKAYSERRFYGNLSDILLPYGFREAPRKERFWTLKHFFKPLQVNPLRMKGLYDLVRSQGMLFSRKENPVVIDSSQIPEDFLEGFNNRDCSVLDCATCGYCEAVAARSVKVDPMFRKESLNRFSEMEEAMMSGRLWGV